MAEHEHSSTDLRAALTGLVIGAVCLFVILFSIVKWTNGRYANEKPAAAGATAP